VPLRLARILLEIAENPKARDRDRIAASSVLLDRGWGKAPAFAAIEGADPLEQDEIAREIRAIADELRAGHDRVVDALVVPARCMSRPPKPQW
jgi:hypothetical protein